MSPEPSPLERGRAALGEASGVLVLTGAGVSAESGVPTFRGSGGLWKSFRAEDLATPSAFRKDPRLVWEWYAWRRTTVSGCRPNAAHRSLARVALRRDDVAIVTQNVDGLHEAAARQEARGVPVDAALPLELHGSLFRVRCTACGQRAPHRGPVDASSPDALPRCGECGELVRPDVVWFGEGLDPGTLERAFSLARSAEACLVVGTSALVHPAASLPLAVLERGGSLVEVNPEPTPLSGLATTVLRGPAGALVPALLEARRNGSA